MIGHIHLVDLGSHQGTKASIVPMMKAELGFFAFLEWKVKASYICRSGNIFSAAAGDAGLESAPAGGVYTISQSAPVNIGIAVMPFSRGWNSSRW